MSTPSSTPHPSPLPPFCPPIHLPQFPPNPSCTLCPLHTRARSVGIPTVFLPSSLPLSPSTPAVLFLGRNPGYQEDVSSLPFIGPSGRLVHNVYVWGLSLPKHASVFYSNLARCYHVDGDAPPRRTYTLCRPHLLPDLSALAPPHSSRLLIVTLGAEAATHLYALAGITKVSLRSAFSRQLSVLSFPSTPSPVSATVLSTFHPAAVLRDGNYIHAVRDHLNLICNYLSPTPSIPTHPEFIPPCFPHSYPTPPSSPSAP